jgi:hypothetical protein
MKIAIATIIVINNKKKPYKVSKIIIFLILFIKFIVREKKRSYSLLKYETLNIIV